MSNKKITNVFLNLDSDNILNIVVNRILNKANCRLLNISRICPQNYNEFKIKFINKGNHEYWSDASAIFPQIIVQFHQIFHLFSQNHPLLNY